MTTTPEPEDSELFRAWRAGDRAAGEALIVRHYDAIARFFRYKASEQAEDLVQRTFLACSDAGGGFRGEGSFRAFLFGVARNLLFEHIRRQVRHRPDADFSLSSLMDLNPGVATLAAEQSEQRLLVRALQHLPLETQVLLELFYWEELSIDEVATALEIPKGTVKSRLFNARALLRETLERLPASDEETRSARSLLDSWRADVKRGAE
jgi:RNA polymerase sigma-70 factor (ECF subfamily)